MAARKQKQTRKRTRTRTKLSLEEWEQIQKLTLMDNDFMNVALEGNIPCVEEMLRVILGRDDLVVRKVQTQRFLKGFARSVYLDVYAEDGEGKLYNIEIQRDDEGADPRRPRFHGRNSSEHAARAAAIYGSPCVGKTYSARNAAEAKPVAAQTSFLTSVSYAI